MTWFTANQVSVNNGSTIVTVTSGEDISNIRAGDALIVGSFSPVEINRAYVDGSNNKIIELKSAWADSNQSNAAARVFPTAGDFKEAANALRAATQLTSDQFQTLTDWGTTNGTVTFTDSSGQQYTARSLAKMDADVAEIEATANNLVGSIVLPTKADFEARHEGKYAGAGFVEWGYHSSSVTEPNVNNGIYIAVNTAYTNGLWTGRGEGGFTAVGNSQYPLAYLAGCIMHITRVNTSTTQGRNFIKFPDAPDGLDKVDGTGRFASLAEAITAGGTSLSASVIHRQDLCILEVFDVNITTSGLPLYPYGNVQYGGSWSGITLADNLVAQGYSAFHVGDTVTKGKGFLPNLTNSAHVKFLQSKDSNCYTNEDGDIIQRQYRIRTIAGLEGTWHATNTEEAALTFSGGGNKNVTPQGSSVEPKGLKDGRPYYAIDTQAFKANSTGIWKAEGMATDALFGDAYNGFCVAVPICLVQRRNKGAYHPVYNLAGCSGYRNYSDAQFVRKWHDSLVSSSITSTAFCMDTRSQSQTESFGQDSASDWAGAIVSNYSGRPDGYYYDAIYASDVLDLRMSAHYINYETVNRVENAKNINATARGWDSLPFVSVVQTDTSSVYYNTSTPSGEKLVKVTGYAKTDNLLLGSTAPYTSNLQDRLSGYISINNILYDTDAYWSDSTSDWVFRLKTSENIVNGASVEFAILWEDTKYYQAEPTWTDIIADPSVLAATFPDGVGGSWIPVIPDDTNKEAKLTKKQNGMLQWVYSSNGGSSWSTNAQISNFNNSTNGWVAAYSSTTVSLISYKAKANFVEPANLTKVLSDFSDVKASNNASPSNGTVLSQSTIGKIPTGSTGIVAEVLPFTKKPFVSNGTGLLVTSSGYLGEHTAFQLPLINSPAFKHFTYITERNGRLYQQVIVKEIIHDAVDGFGDNDVFEVDNGIKTKPDENGNTVIYGCWERPLPYFTNNKVS